MRAELGHSCVGDVWRARACSNRSPRRHLLPSHRSAALVSISRDHIHGHAYAYSNRAYICVGMRRLASIYHVLEGYEKPMSCLCGVVVNYHFMSSTTAKAHSRVGRFGCCCRLSACQNCECRNRCRRNRQEERSAVHVTLSYPYPCYTYDSYSLGRMEHLLGNPSNTLSAGR